MKKNKDASHDNGKSCILKPESTCTISLLWLSWSNSCSSRLVTVGGLLHLYPPPTPPKKKKIPHTRICVRAQIQSSQLHCSPLSTPHPSDSWAAAMAVEEGGREEGWCNSRSSPLSRLLYRRGGERAAVFTMSVSISPSGPELLNFSESL